MEKILALDTSTLSNLYKSTLFSNISVGLDATFASGQRFLITPEVYWEAVFSHLLQGSGTPGLAKGFAEAKALELWIKANAADIIGFDRLGSFIPQGSTVDKGIGEASIAAWVQANKASFDVQILSDNAKDFAKIERGLGVAEGSLLKVQSTFEHVAEQAKNGGLTVAESEGVLAGWKAYAQTLPPGIAQDGFNKLLYVFDAAKKGLVGLAVVGIAVELYSDTAEAAAARTANSSDVAGQLAPFASTAVNVAVGLPVLLGSAAASTANGGGVWDALEATAFVADGIGLTVRSLAYGFQSGSFTAAADYYGVGASKLTIKHPAIVEKLRTLAEDALTVVSPDVNTETFDVQYWTSGAQRYVSATDNSGNVVYTASLGYAATPSTDQLASGLHYSFSYEVPSGVDPFNAVSWSGLNPNGGPNTSGVQIVSQYEKSDGTLRAVTILNGERANQVIKIEDFGSDGKLIDGQEIVDLQNGGRVSASTSVQATSSYETTTETRVTVTEGDLFAGAGSQLPGRIGDLGAQGGASGRANSTNTQPIITGAQVGQIFGSSIGQILGSQLGGDSRLGRIAAGTGLSAVLGATGSSIGRFFDGVSTNQSFTQAVDGAFSSFGPSLAANLQTQSIGAVSNLLTAELASSLGIGHSFGGQLFTTAANSFINRAITNVTSSVDIFSGFGTDFFDAPKQLLNGTLSAGGAGLAAATSILLDRPRSQPANDNTSMDQHRHAC